MITQPDAVRTVVVLNAQGLHMRPVQVLIDCVKKFESQIEIVHLGQRVNGKSFMDILTLVAVKGTELTFEACGPDANAALDEIAKLFESQFGEAEE